VPHRWPARRRVVARVVGLVVLAGLVGACQVDVRIDVAVAGDESGEIALAVELDEAAADEVPDLADALDVGDLRRAGWEVSIVDRSGEPGGGAIVEAVRPFGSLEEAAAVAEELTGADGPLTLAFDRRQGVDVTAFSVVGDLDLTQGLAAFSDVGLRDVLGGAGLGVDEEELERRAGRPLDQAVRIRLDADLPGRAVDGSGPAEARLGTATPVEFRSEVRHDERIAWAAAAGAAAALLGLVLAVRVGRGRWRASAERGNAGSVQP
jgi:hypothetical protein